MAGFLLRPGFGVVRDDLRIDALWRVHDGGPCFPGRRIKSQEYILWRRVAGGLTRERQTRLMAGEIDRIRSGKAPDELVRLAGSLELIPHDTKAELVRCFCDTAVTLARAKRHCAPYLAALGLLLNRTPLYAGPETVVSPDLVEHAYQAFQRFDWTTPELLDLQILFLRAARVVDDRSLDLPMPLRGLIASKLEKSGVLRCRPQKSKGSFRSDGPTAASLYDELLPPGLILTNRHVRGPAPPRSLIKSQALRRRLQKRRLGLAFARSGDCRRRGPAPSLYAVFMNTSLSEAVFNDARAYEASFTTVH